jgi:16S rRNA (cytosine1402-N4)-methyltransferase
MCKEVVDYIKPEDKRCIVDCTLGLGNHAQALLEKMPPHSRLIGIDKDEESLKLAKERLESFKERVSFIHSDFRDIDAILTSLKIEKIDGALFDLGSSLYQLSSFGRGFSFLREGPLDMRMDRTSLISAYDLVNNLSEKELDYIFREYGHERWHRKIAHRIIEERRRYPIATTLRLAEIVEKALAGRREFRIHPATRTFQALRIVVNQELESLRIGLEKITRFLSPKARVCVISFHSLEDKIVKETFKLLKRACDFELLTAKPLKPSSWELKVNPKARSARLRAIEKA